VKVVRGIQLKRLVIRWSWCHWPDQFRLWCRFFVVGGKTCDTGMPPVVN